MVFCRLNRRLAISPATSGEGSSHKKRLPRCAHGVATYAGLYELTLVRGPRGIPLIIADEMQKNPAASAQSIAFTRPQG